MTLLGSRSHRFEEDENAVDSNDDFHTVTAPDATRMDRPVHTGQRRRPGLQSAALVRRPLVDNPDSAQVPTATDPVDRIAVLWSAKWWILGATALVVILTLSVTALFVPATFAGSADVRFTASAGVNGQAQDSVTAANDFAAQYAQIVTSAAVIDAAASKLGLSSSDLQDATSAGTVASQNLVRVTVQADSTSVAQQRADAVAKSLIAEVDSQSAATQSAFAQDLATQLAPLDKQISAARAQVDAATAALAASSQTTNVAAVSGASAALSAAQSQLTSLTDRRNTLSSQATIQSGAGLPLVAFLGASSAPAKVQPQPVLYALIAFVVAMVVGGQVAVVFASRARRYGPLRRRPVSSA